MSCRLTQQQLFSHSLRWTVLRETLLFWVLLICFLGCLLFTATRAHVPFPITWEGSWQLTSSFGSARRSWVPTESERWSHSRTAWVGASQCPSLPSRSSSHITGSHRN